MKFNEQQQQALSHHAARVLVSAGAGSGKTAVLTEAAAQAVRQGVQVANMLVVTYTNAAAAEMKHRIEVRLRELALSPELDGEEKARVGRACSNCPAHRFLPCTPSARRCCAGTFRQWGWTPPSAWQTSSSQPSFCARRQRRPSQPR